MIIIGDYYAPETVGTNGTNNKVKQGRDGAC